MVYVFSSESPPKAIEKCLQKPLLYELCRKVGVKVPHEAHKDELIDGEWFVKPKIGTGSNGARRFLKYAPFDELTEIVQEFLPGPEISVDLYRSFQSGIVYTVPRQRLSTKSGLAVETQTVENDFLSSEAEKIAVALELYGPANVQFKQDSSGCWKLIDVNPRFGGAYICSIMAGMNSSQYIIDDFLSEEIIFDGYKVGLHMARYWEEIYFETDLL